MSKIVIEPNSTGTGTFVIKSPGTDDNPTITLPTQTSTLLSADSSGNVSYTGDLLFNGVGAVKFPVGTTGERPAIPQAGMQRYNSTIGSMEYYNGSVWTQQFLATYQVDYLLVGGGGGGGGGDVATGGSGASGGAVTGSFTAIVGETYSISIGGGGGGGIGSGQVGTGAGAAGAGSVGPGGRGGNAGGAGSSGGGGGGGGGTFLRVGTKVIAAAGGGGGGGGANEDVQNDVVSGGGGNQPRGNNGGLGGSNGFDYSGDGGGGGGGGGGYFGGVGQAQGVALGASGGGNYHDGASSNIASFTGNGGPAASTAGASPVTVTNASLWGYTNNRGAGGGGSSAVAASGGAGILILKYSGAQRGAGGTITTVGSYTVHTFTGDGTFTA